MKIQNFSIGAMLALVVAGEAAAQSVGGLPAHRPKLDASVDFPGLDRASRKTGAFVPPHNVAMVTPGMKKSQIYTLLDVPHFHEGFNVRRWNYILNFYTGSNDDYRSCQYQIRFDAKARVEETYFKDPECASLLDRLLAPAPAVKLDAAPAVVEGRDPALPARTYDFTFAFDSSTIDPKGLEVIRAAATEVEKGGYREVIVTGFTDTTGSVEYNDALAARRAAAVADALRPLVNGVPVYARASRDLEVPTRLQTREQRNRRVQVELYATMLDRPSPTTIR